MQLNIKAFSFASGIFWGLGLFVGTWWLILLEGVTNDRTFIGRIYPGFSLSPGGSVMGLLWGLVDGAICGAIFAWLYNRLRGSES